MCAASQNQEAVCGKTWFIVVAHPNDGHSVLPPFMNLNTGRCSSSAQPLLYFQSLCVYGINLDTLSGSVILYLVHRIGW